MRPGPRKTPTAIRIATGNPSHRSVNHAEPEPAPGLPSCPRHLTGVARRAWTNIGTELARMKVVTTADSQALELLCLAYADLRDATAYLAAHGSTYETLTAHGSTVTRTRPEVTHRSESWRRVSAMLREFGLTPSSRADVSRRDVADEDESIEAVMARCARAKQQ